MRNEYIYDCDLHGHTNRSDGKDTPKEFIDYASARGVKVVAITDHDIKPPRCVRVNGKDEDVISYGLSKGVKVIKGIEISCDTDVEDVHLICLGCDWDDPFFDWLERFNAKSKVKSYKKLVWLLEKQGIVINWNEILDVNGNIPEEMIQKKMIFEMIAQKGYAENWSEAKKMVKSNLDLAVKREKPDPCWIIQNIHALGGVAILAHPYLITEEVEYKGKRLQREEYIDKLIQGGLDGIEASYTYNKTSYDGKLSKDEIYREIVERYSGKLSIISGGSDYHADGKKGVSNPRRIGECGVSESYFYSNPYLKRL